MQAKSIKGKSTEEMKTELRQTIAKDFQPTLAIVFLSVSQDRNGVSALLDQAGISIFGATTNGEFIDGEIGKGSIAILLLDVDRRNYEIYFEQLEENKGREVTQNIARKSLERFSKPAFLIAGCSLKTDAEQLLKGFEDVIGMAVNVFGGMAGDDFSFTEQHVFTNGFSSNQGIVAVAFDEDRIQINGKALCGWKAMGTAKTVTKSEGNHVYTIDGIPALDITAKYGGITNASPANKDLLNEIAVNCPLQLQRESGDPIMRPGLVVDWKDRSFHCSGSVPQGSKVKFSLPPDFDAIEKVIEGCKQLKEEEMAEADAIIYFSCAGRLIAFGPVMSEEIEGVQKIWNVPLAGMFSNAELGRATGGKLEMHNLASCVVVLKEK